MQVITGLGKNLRMSFPERNTQNKSALRNRISATKQSKHSESCFLDTHLIYRGLHLCLIQPIFNSGPQSLSPNFFLTFNLIYIIKNNSAPLTMKS